VKSVTPIPLEGSIIHKFDTAKLQKLIKMKDSMRQAHYTK